MGAKCAAPDRPVVVFTGDAGLYYHLGEIETAVRRRINLVTVVNNNHGGNQSKRGFDRAYDGQPTEQSRELWTYEEVDFARIAAEMGALGIRVDKPGDLAQALHRALCGRPPGRHRRAHRHRRRRPAAGQLLTPWRGGCGGLGRSGPVP